MPVYVIDTLKPKNGLDFPVVEAEDVAVSDELRLPEALSQKAEQTDLEELSEELATKANASDVSAADAGLQAQIDNLITPVTQDAEVQNARVGADGTSYQTLKERLDAESTALAANIEWLTAPVVNAGITPTKTDNLRLKGDGTAEGYTGVSVFSVPVVAGSKIKIHVESDTRVRYAYQFQSQRYVSTTENRAIGTVGGKITDAILTVPEGANYLIYDADTSDTKSGIITTTVAQEIADISAEIEENTLDISELKAAELSATPSLRNGSVGNALNANQVAFTTVENRKSSKGFRIFINRSIASNHHYRITFSTFDVDHGVSDGTQSILSHRVTTDVKVNFKSGETSGYVQLPDDDSIGFSLSIGEYDDSDVAETLRISDFESNTILYALDFSGISESPYQKISLNWLKNSIYAYEGYITDASTAKNRLLSILPKSVYYIATSLIINCAFYAYDQNNYVGVWNGESFQKSAVTWFTGNYYDVKSITGQHPEYDYWIVIANEDKSAITDVEAFVSDIDIYSLQCGADAEKKFVSTGRAIPAKSAFTVINNKLYVLKINTGSDPNANTDVKYMPYPLSERGFIVNDLSDYESKKSNFGHNNSVDYNERNDYLLSSNAGSSSNTHAQEIYLIKSPASKDYLNIDGEDAIRISISSDGHFGKQANCYWGDPNFGRNDFIYVLSNYEVGNMDSFMENNVCDYTGENSARFVHLLQLGKGTNDLGSGNYNAAESDEFNGSYKIIKEWTYEWLLTESINDGQYYNGAIYYNTTYEQAVKIVKLTFEGDRLYKHAIDMPKYNADGTIGSTEGEGFCIHNGYAYIGDTDVVMLPVDYLMGL